MRSSKVVVRATTELEYDITCCEEVEWKTKAKVHLLSQVNQIVDCCLFLLYFLLVRLISSVDDGVTLHELECIRTNSILQVKQEVLAQFSEDIQLSYQGHHLL